MDLHWCLDIGWGFLVDLYFYTHFLIPLLLGPPCFIFFLLLFISWLTCVELYTKRAIYLYNI